MRKPGIAFLVLLVASSAAVPTRAPAAPLSPAGFAAGAVPSQYLRVQYGGGDDDDGPSYQPQHSHHHSNFGSGNGNAIAGLIAGVATMAIQEGLKQKRINDYRQQQQVYQIQNQRQQQARKQNQHQAAQQRRNNEAQVAKQKREEARANEKHQEEVDDLNKQKRELAQLKKDIENQKAAQNKPSGYPPGDNNPAGNTETRTDHTYENDSKDDVVFNIITSRPTGPDPGTIRVGPVTLYPWHIEFPADRTICTGTTAKGCFLRIVNAECIMYCPRPAPPPRPIPTPVVVATPTPTPTPVVYPTPTPIPTPVVYPTPTPIPTPTPVVVVTPTPTPPPVVYPTPIPTPVVYPTPTPIPTPTPVIVVTPTPTPTPVIIISAVDTDKAEDYEEPKRRLTPAVDTDKAEDYEEPKRRLTLAVDTDKAEDYEERKRTLTPAVETEKATAGGGGQLDEAEIINPVECPNLNLSGCGARFKKQGEEAEKKREEEKKIAREEKKKRDDEIARKKKEDEENKFAIEHPGDLDSKKCTAHGDIPVKTLLTKGNYQQLVDTVLGSPTRPDDGPTRTAVTSGLKAIPEVGSLVSGVVSALWKDPANDEMFKALVSYVDALVPDSITKERVEQMKDALGGLWDNLNSYLNEKDLYQKGLDLKLLNNTLEQMRKKFFNDRTEPEKQLALVVAFGTLRLLALKEQILHQDQYYPGHPSSLAVSSMNTAVTQFAKLAADMKSKIIERRLAKLRVEAGHERERRYDADGASYWADGRPNYTAVDDQCDWSRKYIGPDRGEDGMSQINAYKDLAQRMDDVRKAYDRDLDVLLAPIAHWPSITPVAQPAEANGEPLAELDAVSDYLPKDNGKSMGTFGKEVLDNYKLAFANSCDRHFTNESNDVIWEVRGSEGSGVCEPAACVVKPHQTITVHYPVIEKSFRFTVSSNGTGRNAYHDDFEVKQGNVIETGNCAYIKHDGRTGLAKLNDGANGDITFLNGDAAHRLARRRESLKKITSIAQRRFCEKHLMTCKRVHDD